MTALALLVFLVIQAPTDDADLISATTHHSLLTTHHSENVSCGVGAAYLLLQRLGCPVSVEEIEAASPVRADAPMSFADLQLVFENLGFKAEGLRMPLEKLDRPVIAFRPHPKGKVGHFVVVEPIAEQGSGFGASESRRAEVQRSGVRSQDSKVRNQGSAASGPQPSTFNSQQFSGPQPSALNPQHYLLLDPLDPPVKVAAEQLAKAWDGRVLVVYPKGTQLPSRPMAALSSWPMALAACLSLALLGSALWLVFRGRTSPALASGSQASTRDGQSAMGDQRSAISGQLGELPGRSPLALQTGSRLAFPGRRLLAVMGSTWNGGPTFLRTRCIVFAWSVGVVVCVTGGFVVFRSRLMDSGDLSSRGSRGPLAAADHIVKEAFPLRIEVPDWGTSLLIEEGTSHNFGQVAMGEKLSHAFQVKNLGKRDLPLAKLKMNCACNAQVEYEPDVLRPNHVGGIRVSMNAVGYGPQTKPIPFAVVRNETIENQFTLNLSYHVAWLEQVQFVPSRLELGELSSAAGVEREVELVLIGPPDGPTPQLTDLESESPGVHAELVRGEPVAINARTARTIPGQRARFTIRVVVDAQQLAIGKLHGHVTAQTSVGEAKLHVTGEVCRPVVASPASLLVGKSRDTETRHVIRIRRPGQWNRQVEMDRPEDEIVLVSASTATPGVSCLVDSERNQVEVLVAPSAKLAADGGITILAKVGGVDETLNVPLVEF